jgi:hypothetical protein
VVWRPLAATYPPSLLVPSSFARILPVCSYPTRLLVSYPFARILPVCSYPTRLLVSTPFVRVVDFEIRGAEANFPAIFSPTLEFDPCWKVKSRKIVKRKYRSRFSFRVLDAQAVAEVTGPSRRRRKALGEGREVLVPAIGAFAEMSWDVRVLSLASPAASAQAELQAAGAGGEIVPNFAQR